MADDDRIRRSGRQPDPATTGILPLVASLARGTVLRCLYGVLCYSVYVAIFLYVDRAQSYLAYRHVRCGKIVENKLVCPPTLPLTIRDLFCLFLSVFRWLLVTLFATRRDATRLDRQGIFWDFLPPQYLSRVRH